MRNTNDKMLVRVPDGNGGWMGVWPCAFFYRVLQPSDWVCWLHAFSFLVRWKGKMKSKLILAGMFLSLSSFSQTEPIYKQFGNQVMDVSKPNQLSYISGSVNAVFDAIVVLDIYQTKHYGGHLSNPQEKVGAYSAGPVGGYSQKEYDHSIALTNYPDLKNCTINKQLVVQAMKIGTFQTDQGPIELYDCGKLYAPPPLTPEQIKAAQQAAQVRAIADKKRAEQNEINAVHWLESQATNGDVSAQRSLGLHYLNGQGCDTNREQAVYWLTQAANQGDIEASNKLANLQNRQY